jgi:outer membrane lipoprotein-sorting protein
MSMILSLVVLLQGQTAEQTFEKIEAGVAHAKSVQVRFAWEASGTGDTEGHVESSGVVLFKDGNRANLSATIVDKGKPTELCVVSDGTTVRAKLGPKRIVECPTPKNFESGLRAALSRMGALQSVLVAHKVCMLETAQQEDALEPGKMPQLSDFKWGPDDGASKTLTYKITPDGPQSVVEVKLWYTPKTYELVKRTITVKNPSEGVFTEVYRDWMLDQTLDNEEFKLPTVK